MLDDHRSNQIERDVPNSEASGVSLGDGCKPTLVSSNKSAPAPVDVSIHDTPATARVRQVGQAHGQLSASPVRAPVYIFTLDSLGDRHPEVAEVIGTYLQTEAEDKKLLPKHSLSTWKYKAAKVPELSWSTETNTGLTLT